MAEETINFGGIELSDSFYATYDKAKIVMLPVPYEGTVSYGKGAGKGPKGIIEASAHVELYDEELDTLTCNKGISTLPELKPEKDPKGMIESVYKNTRKIIKDNKFFVMLGGEHSISSGAVRAFKEKYSDLTVLQLDAHSDLREEYNGTPYSHAAVMSRIKDICPAVRVGIRSMCDEEAELIKKERIKIFWARDIMEGKNDSWMDEAIKDLSEHVYITFDLDVFDPSILPATGTPEPGGLDWYTVIRFLRKVFKSKNVVGFDVVELSPNKDDIRSDFTAAKLAYKMIGYKFFREKIKA